MWYPKFLSLCQACPWHGRRDLAYHAVRVKTWPPFQTYQDRSAKNTKNVHINTPKRSQLSYLSSLHDLILFHKLCFHTILVGFFLTDVDRIYVSKGPESELLTSTGLDRGPGPLVLVLVCMLACQ